MIRKFSSSPRRQDLAALIEPSKIVLESLHTATGLSWPALIPAATVALRATLTTPLAVANRVVARRQARLQPLLSAVVPVYKAQLAKTSVEGTSSLTPEQITILAAKERRKKRIALYKQFKCQNWRVLLQPMVQIPLFLSMSLCIRALCGWTVLDSVAIPDDFHEHAFLWCHSLATPDPNGVLPLAVGAFMLGNIELQASQIPRGRQGPSVAVFLTNVSRLGAVFFMAMSFQAPSAIGLYWLTSNGYSLVQNLLLNRFLPVVEPVGEILDVGGAEPAPGAGAEAEPAPEAPAPGAPAPGAPDHAPPARP